MLHPGDPVGESQKEASCKSQIWRPQTWSVCTSDSHFTQSFYCSVFPEKTLPPHLPNSSSARSDESVSLPSASWLCKIHKSQLHFYLLNFETIKMANTVFPLITKCFLLKQQLRTSVTRGGQQAPQHPRTKQAGSFQAGCEQPQVQEGLSLVSQLLNL